MPKEAKQEAEAETILDPQAEIDEVLGEEHETPEEDDADDGDAPDDDADLSITIEGEEPDEDEVSDDDLGEKGVRALKRMREQIKESAKAERAAKARVAELEAASAPKKEPLKRPTLEECGYDEDVFAERSGAYALEQAEAKTRADAEKAKTDAAVKEYGERFTKYTEQKATLRVDDFDAAEEAVRKAFTVQQQSTLIRVLDDPAKVIYALGKSKKALADLAAVNDIDRFAFKLAKIEGEVKVTTKSPPKPETRLRGGAAGGVALSTTSLEKMRAAAEKSGDYTAYLAEKRRIKERSG